MALGDFVLLCQTILLVLLSLLILYPVVAYAQNVVHTEAVILLSVSLLIFTISSLVEELLGLVLLAELIHTLSDVTFVSAIWLFAREFITRTDSFDDVAVRENTGGFENAGDD